MPTYFVTFTSYGTWLHGDERGSHDRKGTTERTARLAPDPTIEAQMRLRMKHEPFMLNGPMRKVVRESIAEHCDYRGWRVLELNVRTNARAPRGGCGRRGKPRFKLGQGTRDPLVAGGAAAGRKSPCLD